MPASTLPTVLLPRLPRSLSSLPVNHPSQHLLSLLLTVSELYPSHSTHTTEDGVVVDDAEEEAIDKEDVFERAYAKEWCLMLVRRGEEWAEEGEETGEGEEEMMLRRQVVEKAAGLVALLSETSRSGPMLRPLTIPVQDSLSPNDPLHITLHDALPSSTDATSVGLQSWGSSILLARQIALEPAKFGITKSDPATREKKRVLELGAGTGLLSIVWALMSERVAKGDELEIIATDYHPDVLLNLRQNLQANFPSPVASNAKADPESTDATTRNPIFLTSTKLDWSALHNSLSFARSSHAAKLSLPSPFNVANDFTSILAADVIYSLDHATWLKSVVEWGLKKPSSDEAQDGGKFHLLVPLRDHHKAAIATLSTVFPFASILPPPEYIPRLPTFSTASSSTASSASTSSSSSTTTSSSSSSTATSPASSRRSSLSTPFITRPLPLPVLALSALDLNKKPKVSSGEGDSLKGERIWRLAVEEVEEIKRVKGVGRADELGYKRFVMGWC